MTTHAATRARPAPRTAPDRDRPGWRLSVSLVALVATTSVLARMGRGSLAAPPVTRGVAAIRQWAVARDAPTITMSTLRVVAVVLGGYLVVMTCLGVIARLGHLAAAVRTLDALTPLAVRRLLGAAIGGAVLSAPIAAPLGARFAGPVATPLAVVRSAPPAAPTLTPHLDGAPPMIRISGAAPPGPPAANDGGPPLLRRLTDGPPHATAVMPGARLPPTATTPSGADPRATTGGPGPLPPGDPVGSGAGASLAPAPPPAPPAAPPGAPAPPLAPPAAPGLAGASATGSAAGPAAGAPSASPPTAAAQSTVLPAPPATPGDAAPAPSPAVWTVQPGDSFWNIAARELADSRPGRRPTPAEIDPYWRLVIEDNLGRLRTDANLIHPGQRLVIPPPPPPA